MDNHYEEVKTSEEELPLYDDSITSDEALLEKVPYTPLERNSRTPVYLRFLTVHVCYIIFYSVLSIAAVRYVSVSKSHGPGLIFSPVRPAVHYEVRPGMQEDYDTSSPFFGPPNPQLDQAWLDYLQYSPIRITKDEFKHYNKEGILFGDDSGYLATITMYHDLHCIRYLYQTLHPEYYYPNISAATQAEIKEHSEHCLKALKNGISCHGDITIRTMKWDANALLPAATDNAHECVNWDGVNAWMKSRYVNAFEQGMLVHPVFGPVFPDGEPL